VAFVLVDVVDGADVGVIQSGSSAGFAAKAADSVGHSGEGVVQEFEGDYAPELGVFGFVDYAHAAAAEFFENAVVAHRLATKGSRSRIGTWCALNLRIPSTQETARQALRVGEQ
jgi:hypothetical protein